MLTRKTRRSQRGKSRKTPRPRLRELPEMSERTQRGLRYASTFSEQAQKPVDSTLLLAGYLTVRSGQPRDTCKWLSQYLRKHGQAETASPVELLGLSDRYENIKRAVKTHGPIPPTLGYDNEVWNVFVGATEFAKRTSNRTRVGARHLIAAMLMQQGRQLKVQIALQEMGYDLSALRRALIETIVEFNLDDDSSSAWQAVFDTSPDDPLDARRFVGAVDEPALQDKLGRTRLVETLTAMFAAREQKTPFTVALLGDWGAGKTSVMRQIAALLKPALTKSNTETESNDTDHESGPVETAMGIHPEQFEIAWFNAWEYEHSDNIRAGLSQEVVKGLTKGMGWWAKMCLTWNFAWREHRSALIKIFTGFIAVIAAAGMSAWAAIGLWDKNAVVTWTLSTGTGAGLIAALMFLWNHLKPIIEHPLATELSTYLKLPNYGKHLGMIPVMKRQIRRLCELRLQKKEDLPPRRLIVFVDDLDRCNPNGIVNTLEAIRLVMDLPNVIVVIAISHRIALQAIAAHYAAHFEKFDDEHRNLFYEDRRLHRVARDYLGKIIQLPIRLSRPSPRHLEAYVGSLFEVSEEDIGSFLDRSVSDEAWSLSAGMLGMSISISRDQAGAIVDAPEPFSKPQAAGVTEQQNQKRAKVLEDVGIDTAEELKQFATLTHEYAMHNPREIKRLANAYRFLRTLDELALVDGSELPDDYAKRNMTMLFWLEYVYEMEREPALAMVQLLQNDVDLYALPGEEGKEGNLQYEELKDQWESIVPKIEAMRKFFRINDDKTDAYGLLAGRVRRLILPHFDERT